MQKSNTRRNIFIGAVVIAVLVGGYFVYQNQNGGTGGVSLPSFSKKVTISEPVLSEDLAQTGLITAAEGGVVRAVDAAGIVTTLHVPPGAVEEDVEVTLTPLESNQTELHYGAKVEPENLSFTKPATLSFNWTLAQSKAYQKRPYILGYEPSDKTVELVPAQRPLVVRNFLPAIITETGTYGVSDDAELATAAAKQTLSESQSTLFKLNAGLVLTEQEKISGAATGDLRTLAESVLTAEDPEINEVYFAVLVAESSFTQARLISVAWAYGLLDGYLQFRCNLDETTYEDAMIAMTAAMRGGYTEVAETCRQRAEELLIERANLVDRNVNRPLIDAIEVLQQMQALGLTDSGPGAEVAQRLHNDVQASLHRLAPDIVDAEPSGRARDNGPSTDPLIKNNSTLIQEMIGIEVTRFIGIESFDEAGLKNFGELWHGQMSGLNMVADTMCDLDEVWPLFGEIVDTVDIGREYDKRCGVIESGQLQHGIDWWKDEVDDMAEGVDAVQRGERPNAGWDEMDELQQYLESLER